MCSVLDDHKKAAAVGGCRGRMKVEVFLVFGGQTTLSTLTSK